jgi:hypothetical protein
MINYEIITVNIKNAEAAFQARKGRRNTFQERAIADIKVVK